MNIKNEKDMFKKPTLFHTSDLRSEWNKKAEFNPSIYARGKLSAISTFWGEMAALKTLDPERVMGQRTKAQNGSYTPYGLLDACPACNREYTIKWIAEEKVRET